MSKHKNKNSEKSKKKSSGYERSTVPAVQKANSEILLSDEKSDLYNSASEQAGTLEKQHPALLEKYHNLSNIGRGSQATMIKALDENNKPVAIKVFDLKNTDNWKNIELFEREINVIKNLHVYGVPGYIDTIKSEDYLYLVEEYVDAISLEKQLENGRIFTLDESLKIFERTAAILKDLGECDPPVVHRDVKPANILVDDKLNVSLVDFGVVAKNAATFSMTFAGTAGYVAPEQLYGQATTASDIFSLGATMLHLMTGVSPCDMKLKGISPDIDRYMPASAPTWISILIKQMMAVKPSQRPQTGAELMELIKKGKSTGVLVFEQTHSQKTEIIEKKPLNYKKVFGIIYGILWILYILLACVIPNYNIIIYHMLWLGALFVGGPWGYLILEAKFKTNPRFITSDESVQIESDHSKAPTDLYKKEDLQIESEPKVSLKDVDCIPSMGFPSNALEISKETQPSPKVSVPGLSANVLELMQKAKNGDSDAMVSLGYKYLNGFGVEQDDKQAYDWFYKGAELGNAVAMYDLGYMNANGCGIPVNHRQAVVWYKKAAELGDSCAQYSLGKMYHDGTCVERDDLEAMKWLKKAVASGHAEAECLIGIIYNGYGQGIETDEKEAMQWFLKAAQKGSVGAMYALGYNYRNGIGTQKDITECIKWYQKAADNGYSDAMINLGVLYEEGTEVPRDSHKAMEYYQAAALEGDATAQRNLGVCYYNGIGCTLDYHKAEIWFQKAAEKEQLDAMYHLGMIYYYGKGRNIDYSKAYYWFNKSALLGNADAQNFLGVLYDNGKGVQMDSKNAVYWYQKAAELGSEHAQCNLGRVYKYGLGVDRNLNIAEYWLKKSAEQGNKTAAKELER